MEIPAFVYREIHDVAHQLPYQPLVTDENDVFSAVRLSFFFEETRDASAGFLACFPSGEAEIRRSLSIGFPKIGIPLLDFLLAQVIEKAIVNFIQPFINDRDNAGLFGDVFDGLPRSLVAANIDR